MSDPKPPESRVLSAKFTAQTLDCALIKPNGTLYGVKNYAQGVHHFSGPQFSGLLKELGIGTAMERQEGWVRVHQKTRQDPETEAESTEYFYSMHPDGVTTEEQRKTLIEIGFNPDDPTMARDERVTFSEYRAAHPHPAQEQ